MQLGDAVFQDGGLYSEGMTGRIQMNALGDKMVSGLGSPWALGPTLPTVLTERRYLFLPISWVGEKSLPEAS